VTFEVLIVASIKMNAFWDVVPLFQTTWKKIPEDSYLHSWNVSAWKPEKKAGG
jgi:hypothetical protein